MTAGGTDAREHSVVRASLLLDTTASRSSKKLTAVVVLMLASVALTWSVFVDRTARNMKRAVNIWSC